jgi:HEAT repeat protein
MAVDHQMAHYVATVAAAPVWQRLEAVRGLDALWRRQAAHAEFVQRWAAPVRQALELALHDENAAVRCSAVRGLERLGAAQPLAAVIDDPVDWVRRRAIIGMGRVGPDPYAARLIAALDTPATCAEAAEALGRLNHPTHEAVDALGKVGSPYARRTAARSMAYLARRSRQVRPAVEARLAAWAASADAYQRDAALCGLALLRPRGWLASFHSPLVDPDPEIRIRAAELLLRHAGDRANPLVGHLAHDPSARVRRRFAEALGAAPASAFTIELLDRMVGDADAETAVHAVRQIAAGGPLALPRLRSLVTHPHAPVRATAVRVLGALGGPADIRLVHDRLVDVDPATRSSAAHALAALVGRLRRAEGQHRWPALEPIAKLLHEPDRSLRRSAATALGILGDQRAVAVLCHAVADGRLNREDVWRPLRRLGAPDALDNPRSSST